MRLSRKKPEQIRETTVLIKTDPARLTKKLIATSEFLPFTGPVVKVPKSPDCNHLSVPQIWTSGPALRTFVRKPG